MGALVVTIIIADDSSQITVNMKDLQSIIDARVEEKIANSNNGINSKSILMESSNTSLKAENVDTKSFTNNFKEDFSKYFEYNSETGEITCLQDGYYIIWLKLSILSTGDWLATYLRCVVNDIIIGEAYSVVNKDTPGGDDSNNISVYLKKGDKIKFTKITSNANSTIRNDTYVKLIKM